MRAFARRGHRHNLQEETQSPTSLQVTKRYNTIQHQINRLTTYPCDNLPKISSTPINGKLSSPLPRDVLMTDTIHKNKAWHKAKMKKWNKSELSAVAPGQQAANIVHTTRAHTHSLRGQLLQHGTEAGGDTSDQYKSAKLAPGKNKMVKR